MRRHNINIYFSEKTYNKIKPLIAQRKVSEFVNQVVEKELAKEQKKEKAELKKQLIAAYQRQAKNKKLQSELAHGIAYQETVYNVLLKRVEVQFCCLFFSLYGWLLFFLAFFYSICIKSHNSLLR